MKRLASVIALSAGIGFVGGTSAYAAGEYLHAGNSHVEQVEACARNLGAAATWENNFDSTCWPTSSGNVKITLPNGNWHASTKAVYDALGQQEFMREELSLARQEDRSDRRIAAILSMLGGAFASVVAFGCLYSDSKQYQPPNQPASQSAPDLHNIYTLPVRNQPGSGIGNSHAA